MKFNWRFILDCLAKGLVGGAVSNRGRINDDTMDVAPVAGVRTLYDEARVRWPDASPVDIEHVMWLTPYPMSDRSTVVASLSRMRERWGPNIHDAINGEMAEFDSVWARERHKYEGDVA